MRVMIGKVVKSEGERGRGVEETRGRGEEGKTVEREFEIHKRDAHRRLSSEKSSGGRRRSSLLATSMRVMQCSAVQPLLSCELTRSAARRTQDMLHTL